MNLIPELSVSAGRTATAIIAICAARPAATKGYCTHPKVYGVRGLANAQILAEAPTSGFCNSGSSTEVTRTARWYRSCLDSDAGVADRPFGHESGRQSNHSRLSLLAGALLPLMIVLGLSLLPLPAAARRPQAPPPPPPPPPATTMRAYDFYSKFGVNTNLNAGQSVASIEQDLT